VTDINTTPPHSLGLALAELLAAQIRASKSPPGTVIASAHELRSRHDAGRPVVRQAVRILGERGIAYMRRGVGGGLVVASPTPAFPARAVSIAIEYGMEKRTDVGPLQMAIDTHVFLHGATRLSWSVCENLRRLARRLNRLSEDEFERTGAHQQLFSAIRTASGDPTILLAQQTSMECTIDLIPYSANQAGGGKREISWQLTLETAEALISGDTAWLFDCNRRQLALFEANRHRWEEIERDPQLLPKINDSSRPEFQVASNRADRLAREILREIRLTGWTIGERIGCGTELTERYGAGPDIVRQATLMLQEHGAVRVERGRNGGLYVAKPDQQRAVMRARVYLEQSAATPDEMRRFLLHLALQTFDGFPERNPARLRRNAEAMLASRSRVARAGNEVRGWQLFSRLCGNPVLHVFTETIAPLIPAGDLTARALDDILHAVASGDTAKGRRFLLAATA
jgi:DNA-binding FadR family transcriptional regulator